MGSPPNRAPNAGGVAIIAFFDLSRNLRLRRLIVENLCPSATVVRVHDCALADEHAVSSTFAIGASLLITLTADLSVSKEIVGLGLLTRTNVYTKVNKTKRKS